MWGSTIDYTTLSEKNTETAVRETLCTSNSVTRPCHKSALLIMTSCTQSHTLHTPAMAPAFSLDPPSIAPPPPPSPSCLPYQFLFDANNINSVQKESTFVQFTSFAYQKACLPGIWCTLLNLAVGHPLCRWKYTYMEAVKHKKSKRFIPPPKQRSTSYYMYPHLLRALPPTLPPSQTLSYSLPLSVYVSMSLPPPPSLSLSLSLSLPPPSPFPHLITHHCI